MAELKISIQKDTRPNRTKPYLVRWTGEHNPHTALEISSTSTSLVFLPLQI